jgi:hypothetical protein
MTDDSKSAANRAARNEKKEAYLRAIYDRYTTEFRATGDQDLLSVARNTHMAMDELLQRDRAKIPAAKISNAAKAATTAAVKRSKSGRRRRPCWPVSCAIPA